MRRNKSAWMMGALCGAVALVTLTVGGSPARAGVLLDPELSIAGGTGVPGGTVAVTLSLADDVEEAGVSAGIDLVFGEELEFFEPVADSCAVSERLMGTHGVAGRLLQPGVLNLEVFVAGTPNPLPPLGNGALVSCDFRIKTGVPAGTAALEIESPFLGDDQGQQIPVRVSNGSVRIVTDFPTATPTATATPQPTNTATVTATAQATSTTTNTPVTPDATATVTNTPVTPPTATATNTPPTQTTATATATRTGTGATPTATRKKTGNGDGCSVTPVTTGGTPGASVLLLLPALMLWARRRRS